MGPFLVADEAWRVWQAQGAGLEGSLVITTSVNAVVPKAGSFAYDTSKAATNHLVRELAVAFAPLVRVNGVAPATVLEGSSMFPRERVIASLAKYGLPCDAAESTEVLRDRLGEFYAKRTLTGRPITLADQIGAIAALLGGGFSKTTGQIVTRTRLNLYWHLRKITGPNLLFVYNIVNALMFCFLAGSMISVAATAVGLPFGMTMPKLNDVYPNSVGWVLVVFLVGIAVTALAILGFQKIAAAGQVASPWMFMVFVGAAVAVLPKLGVTSVGDFWRVASERIWTGVPAHGVAKFTFWHIMFFAWFCNMAMHIGMADMTVLRYAKRWHYGFLSACGMYLGHFVAWIASGILCAAALGDVAPGPIAYLGAGVTGAATVVIASWTTAHPTLYRAGLALQTISPNWKRWKVTLAAGAVTTAAAIFPALMMRLLDFVALYGLILMPVR